MTDEILGRGVDALERAAAALELLAQDPVIQVETMPPVCPHCDRMNPMVRVEESSATGPLAEFVIQAHCTHCNKVFYALPVQWGCVRTMEEASEEISERREIGGFDSDTDQRAPVGANAARPGGL